MRTFLLIIMLVFLVSCSSSLSVQVDVFDPKGLSAEDTREATVQRLAAQYTFVRKTDQYARVRADLKDQLRTYLELLAQPSIGIVAQDDVERIASVAASRIDAAVNEAAQKRYEGIAKAELAATAPSSTDRQQAFDAALELFGAATNTLTDLRAEILKPYEGPLKDKLLALQAAQTPDLALINDIILAQNNIDTAFEKNIQSLTGGLDLFDDPLAPAIIASSDRYWHGVYNQTEASANIGNSDIAIKMETIGTFTIKGLRMDASKVTAASFEVLKQSVRMVAAAYGVPTPSSVQPATAQPANTSGTISPTDLLLSVDQLQQAADRIRQLSRIAALSLLDIIVGERDLESSDPTKRQAAVQRIKTAFEAYKLQLSGK